MPTDPFSDSLSAAKTRVLAIQGVNYWPAILPEIVALSRTFERILERTWLDAYKCRWQEIAELPDPVIAGMKFDFLACALLEIQQNPLAMI